MKIIGCLSLLVLSCWGCSRRANVEITIVDIGHLNRDGIARELRIVQQYSPKVIGLDFFLMRDSLDKDVALAEEIRKSDNLVQATMLKAVTQDKNVWDSLKVSHPKFRSKIHGFSNFTITDDSVFVPELPVSQIAGGELVNAFGYQIAKKARGVKQSFRKTYLQDFTFREDLFTERFNVIRAANLFSGKFRKKEITNRIVLMGFVGDEDSYFLDKKKKLRISGVEIQAGFVLQLLENRRK